MQNALWKHNKIQRESTRNSQLHIVLDKNEDLGQRKPFKTELTRIIKSRTQMQFLPISTERVISKVLHKAQKIAYADIEKLTW